MKTLKATLAITATLLSISAFSQSSRSVTKDFDGDGYLSYEHGGNDCNDLNFRINPGAKPKTNGEDCNCNGIADYQESVFEYTDINHSEKVDVADLCIMLQEFGNMGASTADVNQDLQVNSEDLDKLLNTYNSLTYGF